ncbi:MAG TPA: hypothetical protein VFW96_20295 [Thermomicrobiales bacterium]|nr:hypothetical protein [Thermomicrobiales bacterium]
MSRRSRARRQARRPAAVTVPVIARGGVAVREAPPPGSDLHAATQPSRARPWARPDARAAALPVLGVAGAALLWALSLRHVPLGSMTDLGLVSVLPATFYAALLLLTVSFCASLQRWRTTTPVLLLHVLLLIGMIHATPAILYGTARYSWVWKHAGIVDYILRHHSVNPNIDYLGAYHNWPGFFALGALLTQAAGFTTPLSFEAWAPVFSNLLYLGALLLIFRALTTDRRVVWLGAWIFFLTNWVGQDDFAPQAASYFLHLVIVGIALRWLPAGPLTWPALDRWPRAARLVARRRRSAEAVAARPAPGPSQQAGFLVVVTLLFVAIASSHQLTPFMTILAVGALVLVRRCGARGLPLLLAVITATWVSYMAVAFLNGNLHWIIESIGTLNQNADSNLIDLAQASPGQAFVAVVDRLLSAGIWGLALLGGLRRLKHGSWDLAAGLLAVAPFPMLVANSYGGEMLFRVYFFALPFAAFFAAALVYPRPSLGTSPLTAALSVALSVLLLSGFVFAYYGKERMNYFTPNEVAAADYLYGGAPAGSLLLAGSYDYPALFERYEEFSYVTFVSMPKEQRAELLSDPVGLVGGLMREGHHPAAYLIITRSQKAHVEMTGLLPAGTLERVEAALRASPQFTIVYQNPDAVIFRLAGR